MQAVYRSSMPLVLRLFLGRVKLEQIFHLDSRL
jgi:hypothetical protein